MKTTAELAQALVNLRGNHDFDEVLKWVREYEAEEVSRCRKLTDVPLYRAQGAADALSAILLEHASAPNTLDKFKPKR